LRIMCPKRSGSTRRICSAFEPQNSPRGPISGQARIMNI
jgi:hypothetical protein